jgi:hypothetical protein
MVDTSDCIHGGVAHGAKDDRPLLLLGEGHWLEQWRRTGVRRIRCSGYSREVPYALFLHYATRASLPKERGLSWDILCR